MKKQDFFALFGFAATQHRGLRPPPRLQVCVRRYRGGSLLLERLGFPLVGVGSIVGPSGWSPVVSHVQCSAGWKTGRTAGFLFYFNFPTHTSTHTACATSTPAACCADVVRCSGPPKIEGCVTNTSIYRIASPNQGWDARFQPREQSTPCKRGMFRFVLGSR